MRRLSILLLAIMCAGAMLGQNKRVAVVKPTASEGVDPIDISIVRGKLVEHISAIQGYEAFTRTDIDQIAKEMAFEQGGMVNDDDRKKLGVLKGVDVILVSTLTYGRGRLNVEAKFVHIETGKIENSISQVMNPEVPEDMETSCGMLAEKLIKISSSSTNTNRGSTNNSSYQGTTGGGGSSGRNKTFTVGGVTFEMVYVQGGSFTMGCTAEQGSDCSGVEKPPHRVNLPDFYIGKYEVTQLLWRTVMGENPSEWKGDNLPVENVSWDDCQTFISRLNSLTGQQFRLPTEAQWEYAARGGAQSKGYKYSGSHDADDVAWYYRNSGSRAQPVGTKKPNELGIYDMSGNVREWCLDWNGDGYYGYSAVESPTGPSSGLARVLRGGGWHCIASSVRVAARGYLSPGARNGHNGRNGFRVVLP